MSNAPSTRGDRLEEALALSDVLHQRVRQFAEKWSAHYGNLANPALRAPHAAEFDELALDLVAFQSGTRPASADALSQHAVPADCFRFGSVFRFPRSHAQVAFVTSGTTGRASGVHLLRDARTYDTLSLLGAMHGLGFATDERTPPPLVVALAPWTGTATSSSLGHMMQRCMERFDGRSLCMQRKADSFRLDDPRRWLVSERGVDLAALYEVTQLASTKGVRVVVLATSFALVTLLDQLGSKTCRLPAGSVVMPTGGFKGRTRHIAAHEMQRELHRVFGDIEIIGEYGMTELCSQLYERRSRAESSLIPGVYLEPPWLRVLVCDPVTYDVLPDGQVGIAAFVDLGNVDSAAVVLTQDRVRREGDGIRLMGRLQEAPLRGCSLAVEALLSPSRPGAALLSPSQPGAAKPSRERALQSTFSAAGALPPTTPLEIDARLRIERLLNATRRLATSLLSDRTTAGITSHGIEALARDSGLSVQGVKLALERALELEPTDQELDELMAWVAPARTAAARGAVAWIVLSATVFTAAHRALALGLAVSSDVRVKPSRRAPGFVRELHSCAPHLFSIVDQLETRPGDHVFAYGSDETLTAIAASLPAGVHFHGHGHGIGVAVVGAGASVAESAEKLAADIVLFDQRGCLSPRLTLLHPNVNAAHFQTELAARLEAWERQVPQGALDEAAARAAAWAERVARQLAFTSRAGKGWVANYGSALERGEQVPLAPPCRALSLAVSDDPVHALLDLKPLITCIGYAGAPPLRDALVRAFPRARHVPIGEMQRPRLDGPVDRRGDGQF